MSFRRIAIAGVALACAAGFAPAAADQSSADDVAIGPSGYFSTFAGSRPVQWRPADGTEPLGVDAGSGYGAPGPLVVAADPPAVPGTLSPHWWRGDRSAALGGAIGLQMRLYDGQQASATEVRLALRSSDGVVLRAAAPNPDPDGYMPYITEFQVPLTASSWTTTDGAAATDAELEAVLGDLKTVEVSAPVNDDDNTPTFFLYSISMAGPPDVGLSRVVVIDREPHRIRGYVPLADPCATGREVSLSRVRPDGGLRVIESKAVGKLKRFGFSTDDLRAGQYVFGLGEDTADGVTCTAATSRPVTVR